MNASGPVAWFGRIPSKAASHASGRPRSLPESKEAQLRRSNSGRNLARGWPCLALALVCALALAAPLTSGADSEAQATVSPGLLDAAHARPDSAFSIIVQGEAGTEAVAEEVENAVADAGSAAAETAIDESFVTVPGVAATLTGDEVVALASSSEPLVITEDTALTAAEAPANIIPPAITGTARAGEAVTADPGFWAGTPPLTYSYQWERCTSAGTGCEGIDAGTSATYTLTGADVGSVVRVAVSASGTDGSASASSVPTTVVAAAVVSAVAPVEAPKTTADPTVSGREEPGQVLTATPGTWSGGDLAYSYHWQRCSKRFRAAAVLADSPLGYWRLGESEGGTAADASGNGLNGTYIGPLSYRVGGVTGDSNTGVDLGGTATVDVPGIADGAFSSGFTVEAWVKVSAPQTHRGIVARRLPGVGGMRLWLDEDGDYGLVAGGRAPTYLRTAFAPSVGWWEHLVGTWDGSMLRLYKNGALIGSQELSGALGEPGVNLKLGTYSGAAASLNGALDEVAAFDRALSPGDVRGHYSGCENIPGATEASYTAAADDLGLRLRASVRVSNSAGSSTSASAQTGIISAPPPSVTSPPTILGTVEEGQTLTAAHGGWDGTPPFTFTHQWQRCDANGASCSNIAGATEPGYTAGSGDVGRTIRLRVTATNLGGNRWAYSQASETVTAVPATLPAFKQHWPYVAGVSTMLADPAAQGAQATIAIVDSGIDTSRADFGGRVIEQMTTTDRNPNSPGDGYGHGTAVASVAAGGAEGYTGAAPDAKLVSIDVLDDDGVANTSDVIEAADWIYENRERLGIRVANFSLHGTTLASLVSDPLDKAVERLWQSGVVVVAAAGNYAVDGEESAVPFAPGNDPFVLTVGATDTLGSFTQRDDVLAPWSAWGYTRDGFAKPELVAPGRYIAAAVSSDAKLARERPERVVEPGYLQLSGTSLAAPVVAGSAATMLGEHPTWTPDEVKGALMLTAKPLPQAAPRSAGVGAVSAADAAAVINPPNPNLALDGFLVPDPAGGPTRVFDADRWTQAVETDVAWGSVAWGSVAWGSAAWSSVAWGSVAWGSVAWGSVAWGSVAWGSVAWGSDANDDVRSGGPYWVRKD